MQSPGRSDHSRDDSLIADDASSTGNKDDDDDDDEDDANDENDGFSRDPERLKAFNVSNGIDTDICFNVSSLECFSNMQFFSVSQLDSVKQKRIVPNKIGLVSSNIKEEKSVLKDGRGACIGFWRGGNTNLGKGREAGAPLPRINRHLRQTWPGVGWLPNPQSQRSPSHISEQLQKDRSQLIIQFK